MAQELIRAVSKGLEMAENMGAANVPKGDRGKIAAGYAEMLRTAGVTEFQAENVTQAFVSCLMITPKWPPPAHIVNQLPKRQKASAADSYAEARANRAAEDALWSAMQTSTDPLTQAALRIREMADGDEKTAECRELLRLLKAKMTKLGRPLPYDPRASAEDIERGTDRKHQTLIDHSGPFSPVDDVAWREWSEARMEQRKQETLDAIARYEARQARKAPHSRAPHSESKSQERSHERQRAQPAQARAPKEQEGVDVDAQW